MTSRASTASVHKCLVWYQEAPGTPVHPAARNHGQKVWKLLPRGGVTLGVLRCPLLGWARLSHSVGLHVASSDGLTRKALRLHAGHWGPQGPLKVIQKAGWSPGPPQPCRHHSDTVCTYPMAHPWPWPQSACSPGSLGTSACVTFLGQTVHRDKPHLKHGTSRQALG